MRAPYNRVRSARHWFRVLPGLVFGACLGTAGEPPAIPASSAQQAYSGLNRERILGVIPNYQTVDDGGGGVAPLTRCEKWDLALKDTMDPFNVLSAAFGSAVSQAERDTPDYGQGSRAIGERFGAAWLDLTTQNFFSAGLAGVFHQDPRYFRKGPQAGIARRVLYSVTRLVVTRQDSGARAFNVSGLLGMSMGIAASNIYYPPGSARGTVMLGRVETSLTGQITSNLLSEFWPDIQHKFFHKHRH